MKRFALALLGLGAVCGIAQAADTVTPQELSQQQAVESARRSFLEVPLPAGPPDLRAYQPVPLDPTTWGERYWAFRFATQSNTIYYVNKQSGFVQAVGDGKIMTGHKVNFSTNPKLPPELDAEINVYWNLKFRKRSLGDEYLITVTVDSLKPPTMSYRLVFDLRESHSQSHPKYYYPERKFIGLVNAIEKVRTAQFRVKKRDLEKYDYVCAIILGPHSGTAQSRMIGEIPDE
ncbi:MAG: hypothetical protein NT105_18320 [Verrucomicrobia bacterium]|nr:hypothetical protein [Verrucomicrobiota bacterium]